MAQIDTSVETDPNALYTYAEYSTAAEMLHETVRLRAESVRGQLDGSIPSTDAGQRTDSSALVDASSIDLSVMGTMMGGERGGDKQAFNGGNRGGNRPQGASSVPGGDVPGTSIASTTTQNLIWYGGMLLLVLVGLSVAALYKRR